MKKLLFVLYILSFFSCNTQKEKVFILPYNFRGKVELIYDIANTSINDTIIVSKNGIATTSSKYSSGYLNNKFYILDSLGKKKQVYVLNRFDDDDCNKLAILYERIRLNGNYDNINSKYSYIFFVGTKNNLKWCK